MVLVILLLGIWPPVPLLELLREATALVEVMP
jgi:hypothetical protein